MRKICDGEHEDDNDCVDPARDTIHNAWYCPTKLAFSMTFDNLLREAETVMREAENGKQERGDHA